MGTVLILAREDVVAALLGLLVELRGLEPRFLGRSEKVEEAIGRERPAAVVIDCDHPECDERLLHAVRQAAAVPVLFSPFRVQSEVSAVADRHGARSFILPTDPDTFGKMLEA